MYMCINLHLVVPQDVQYLINKNTQYDNHTHYETTPTWNHRSVVSLKTTKIKIIKKIKNNNHKLHVR